jgi:hypothetical protein
MEIRRRKFLTSKLAKLAPNCSDDGSLDGALSDSPFDRCAEVLLSTTGPLNSANRFRSHIVGFSCLLMALPGVCYIVQGRAPFFGVGSLLIGLCSFFSDFVTASAHDFCLRDRRRAFAADLAAIYGYLVLLFIHMLRRTTVWATFCLFGTLFLGVVFILGWSGRATNPQQWRLRHSLWHVFITALSAAAHDAIYPGSLPGGAEFSRDRATILPLVVALYFCCAFMLCTVADASWSLWNKKGVSWFEWWSSQRYPGRQDIVSSVAL